MDEETKQRLWEARERTEIPDPRKRTEAPERAKAAAPGSHLDKPLSQFAPVPGRGSYPGIFGWGFDSNGFRIIMYGPKEKDHIVASYPETSRKKEQEEGWETKTSRREERRDKRRLNEAYACQRKEEHGPAHVHVIDRHTGHETRFKLIEPYEGGHLVEPLHTSDNPRKNGLTPAQIRAVTPILEANAPRFIQLWRELYQDTKLSCYVTRRERYGKGTVEQILDKQGNIVCRDEKGRIALIPPPNRAR